MSSLKEIMVKGMNKIMLDCDEATLLATQQSAKELKCLKRTQLRMHLMGCKLCRAFVEQTKLIDEQLQQSTKTDFDDLELHLTVSQKERLQKSVDNSLK